jgi:hypothetical protein
VSSDCITLTVKTTGALSLRRPSLSAISFWLLRTRCGRLPAANGDRVTAGEDGQILVEGRGWAARVTVAPDPWRVISVEEIGDRKGRWSLELDDHTLSVPGRVRVENRDGRWAELELVRLEWNQGGDLPALPALQPCVFESKR